MGVHTTDIGDCAIYSEPYFGPLYLQFQSAPRCTAAPSRTSVVPGASGHGHPDIRQGRPTEAKHHPGAGPKSGRSTHRVVLFIPQSSGAGGGQLGPSWAIESRIKARVENDREAVWKTKEPPRTKSLS